MIKSQYLGICLIKEFFHFCTVINKTIKYQNVFNRIALLLIMLFAAQVASNALFYHTHIVEGNTYAHAHPGCDDHTHKAADFAFYQQLQILLNEDMPVLLAEQYPFTVSDIDPVLCVNYYKSVDESNVGRAPPIV